MTFDFSEAINGIVVTAVAGAIAAIGFGIRKAIKNFGKTEAEIRQTKLEKALKELEKAQATPDPADDLPAAKAVELAERKRDMARRLQALTDGVSEAPPSEPK
jgi:hypothetical protein